MIIPNLAATKTVKMKIVRIIVFSALISITSISAKADEGMWLPQLLQLLNEGQMKSLGMKIKASDIYSINKGSLKDAIVSFGGFCTGSVISNEGLVLTNHHCGFDAIQNHSSLEHNYIRDGFWAKSFAEELPNKGLFVTFIVRIEDVSKQILEGVSQNMTEADRQSQVDKNTNKLKTAYRKEATQDLLIRPFFEGNQYFLFVTETFKDVRLVGAPPASIGNFGKDTDNWMWPRHTGDFSMFRIYASKDNKPADYSADNVPYKPKRALNISLAGVKENDFTMVFGFPARTQEYLYSAAVEQVRTVNDPAKISVRTEILKIMDGYMRSDEAIKIKYGAKYANVQNAYKKWQGEVLGLTAKDAYAKKKKYEAEFQRRINANADLKDKYGTLLNELEIAYADIKPYGLARDLYTELVSRIELYQIFANLNSLASAYKKDGERGYNDRLKTVKANINGLLEEFDVKVDKSIAEAMLKIYESWLDAQYISPNFEADAANGLSALVNKLYARENLYNIDELNKILAKSPSEALADIESFEAVTFFRGMLSQYQSTVQANISAKQDKINKLQRTYMQAQLDVFKDKKFFPDANSTLRVAFGQVKSYQPKDAVKYYYLTTLDGVMEKYKPGDYEYDVPQRLRDLYKEKDYGRYGAGGIMPVCFIATNHTTGGNSGSPALDARGNLIGLNFDRVWEGTMSDINYDADICRNIMVDIRYVLFIVDKFAGANRLVKEMKVNVSNF